MGDEVINDVVRALAGPEHEESAMAAMKMAEIEPAAVGAMVGYLERSRAETDRIMDSALEFEKEQTEKWKARALAAEAQLGLVGLRLERLVWDPPTPEERWREQ